MSQRYPLLPLRVILTPAVDGWDWRVIHGQMVAKGTGETYEEAARLAGSMAAQFAKGQPQ